MSYLIVRATGPAIFLKGAQGSMSEREVTPEQFGLCSLHKLVPSEPGLYKATVRAEPIGRGRVVFSAKVGKKVDPAKEIASLQSRSSFRRVRSQSPGIRGFQQRINAASAMQENRSRENVRFAERLSELVADGTLGGTVVEAAGRAKRKRNPGATLDAHHARTIELVKKVLEMPRSLSSEELQYLVDDGAVEVQRRSGKVKLTTWGRNLVTPENPWKKGDVVLYEGTSIPTTDAPPRGVVEHVPESAEFRVRPRDWTDVRATETSGKWKAGVLYAIPAGELVEEFVPAREDVKATRRPNPVKRKRKTSAPPSSRAAWAAVERLRKRYGTQLDMHSSRAPGARRGGMFWIDMIEVTPRRSGHGRELVEAIERAARIDGYERIRVFAADTGDGKSNAFWEALGFRYDYVPEEDDEDVDEDDDRHWYMSKSLMRRQNPVLEPGPSPLTYEHGWPVLRLAMYEPSVSEPTKHHTYFAETERTVRYGKTGRAFKKPRVEKVPGAGPGIVAFLDYHLLPGTGKGGSLVVEDEPAPERTDAVYIDYLATRTDQTGLGHAKTLVEHLYRAHPNAMWIDFGDIYHDAAAKLYKRQRALSESKRVPHTHGKIR